MNVVADPPPATSNDGPASRAPAIRLLSIVVLTYNRAELLAGCLESLGAQADPGVPIEIIVVDDGSTDATATMVGRRQAVDPRVRYCPRPHGGIGAARNTGLANARGDPIAIVADDYVLAPDYARTVVSFFRNRPDASVVRFKLAPADDRYLSRVLHAYQEASERRRIADGTRFRGHRAIWRRLKSGAETVTTDHGLEAAGAAAFRRRVFDRVGRFDESFERAEDTDFTARLRAAGVAIHYDPGHRIGHRYETKLAAALATAYRSGRFRWRYYAKHGAEAPGLARLARMRIVSKLSALYWAVWRAAQTGSAARFASYLPVMVLIEGANKAGFVAEAGADRGRARAILGDGSWPRRLRSALLRVPSGRWNPLERPRRRVRLIATTMVRNERDRIEAMLRNVGAQVDGIVALDDGSTDGTAQILAGAPEVIEVLRNPTDRERWDEPGGHRRLVAAALAHGADWIVAIDADERLERDFRERAERVIRRGRLFGLTAYALTLRELWGTSDTYRADGVWGRKRVARLFRARADHRFDERPLHASKAPLQGRVFGRFPPADLVVYHLRMIRPEDRIARRDRYLALDPQARWQPGIGYDYLTDERGAVLRRVPRRRDWRD